MVGKKKLSFFLKKIIDRNKIFNKLLKLKS